MQRAVKVVKSLWLAGFFVMGVFLAVIPTTPTYASHCNKETEQELSIAIKDPNTGADIHCIAKKTTDLQSNPIIGFLRTVLQFMIAGIGIALVGGLTVGGVMYSTARANAQQVQKAEEVIRNVLIGVALYVFAFAIINFIIPGGILQVGP